MFTGVPTIWLAGIFVAAGATILVCGLRMTGLADRIADRTGLGEAIIGGVLLGAATSLSGSIVSLTAALDGRASMAFSNGIGGIAAQTAFLAVADLVYRRANLEHASAELANILQGAILLVLLTIPLIAFTAPPATVWSVHPASVAIVLAYAWGLVATRRVREQPMWKPVETSETAPDVPEDGEDQKSSRGLILIFLVLMMIMGLAGFLIARTAGVFIDRFGLSSTLVGALMTAVVTSLPELVTTVAAVRRGALQLAVGGIIGGNTFDTLFLTVSDFGYRDGSLYHALMPGDLLWLAVGMAMTGVLLMGLILRQKQGPGNIGWESVTMLALYGGAIAIQLMA